VRGGLGGKGEWRKKTGAEGGGGWELNRGEEGGDRRMVGLEPEVHLTDSKQKKVPRYRRKKPEKRKSVTVQL